MSKPKPRNLSPPSSSSSSSSLYNHYINTAIDVLHNPTYSTYLIPLLLLADALLSSLIITRIPYTEIDWKAYMQQISQYRAGERDYGKIYGGTGPLVYGAGHVYVYNALYMLTGGGRDVRVAQWIFGGVYLLGLGVVMGCYFLAKAPPYIFVLLILSKRLHSIFMLRLFNDCFAVLALFTSIFAYQRGFYTVGSLIYSFGLGTKLSLALAGPAMAAVLFQVLEPSRAINSLMLMLQVQIVIGYPFWSVNGQAYFGRAFELGRKFLFKWTVNWRFVGKQTFLSREFAMGLLATNAALLCAFSVTRWLRPSGLSPWRMAKTIFKPLPEPVQRRIRHNVTPNFILTSVLTSMITGILCARSLHYQFYAYIAWSTPFLLWKSGFPPYLTVAIWAAQEWAWNVYPSTEMSSIVVVACLASQVIGVWWGTRNEFADVISLEQEDDNTKDHTE